MKLLSIVVPAYNEEKFIGSLLEKIAAVPTESCGYKKEIVVVDDGSTDGTGRVVSAFSAARLIRQENQGKGSAVQRGIKESSGDYFLVQDADLEYEPADYIPMLEALNRDNNSVVYGSRTLGHMSSKHPNQGTGAWIANWLISIWTLLLYGKWISDPLTAYKLYPTSRIRAMNVRTHGFETDHELTAKLLKQSISIVEVPIRYQPRSVEEGKKIRARDGFIAIWTLLRFRFGD